MTTNDRTVVDYPFEAADDSHIPRRLPVLPLKDMVAFPFMIAPLFVTRESSIAAIEEAIEKDRMVLLVAQRDSESRVPEAEDLYEVGTVGVLMRMFRLPDQRVRILVQGITRARITGAERKDSFLLADIRSFDEPADDEDENLEVEALMRSTKDKAQSASLQGKGFSPEVMVVIENLESPGRLADLIASNLDLPVPVSQSILETLVPLDRLALVHEVLSRELEMLHVQEQITNQAKGEIDKSQREYFLRQQMKAIQTELGEADDLSADVLGYRQRVAELQLSEEARQEADRQINRLQRMQSESAEAAIVRNYLDWIVSLPWGRSTEDNLDLGKARQLLEKEHYNLEAVKTRIIEYLAVMKLKRNLQGPILCLVGPPGVGKTSLGRAIAKALGRKFVRISLGGIHDEAEIRGHRRTYVGAMPGKIIQALRYAERDNPVMVLDEVDKMGSDSRGDPAAALLEVLDTEQNHSFRDNFLNVPFDLSRVIFVATANVLDTIRPAFRDRMEVLSLAGYTDLEKLRIARRYLIPRQIAAHGLSPQQVRISEGAIKEIISSYTNEAGVRNLEREIASICRKTARRVAEGEPAVNQQISRKQIFEYLGPARRMKNDLLRRDTVGVATALAWTPTGGEVFFVESIGMRGSGKLTITGQLGDVMKESAQAAMSYARGRAGRLGIDLTAFEDTDFHVHVPEGAIPKDGPSAGVALAIALISASALQPVRHDVAFTGEITLRGRILPVGGIKEKVLAAERSRIRTILLPKANQQDLLEIPEPIRKKMEFVLVENMDDAVRLAFRDHSVRRRVQNYRDRSDSPTSPLPMKPRW
jgi:ATP-dependent Lon protease